MLLLITIAAAAGPACSHCLICLLAVVGVSLCLISVRCFCQSVQAVKNSGVRSDSGTSGSSTNFLSFDCSLPLVCSLVFLMVCSVCAGRTSFAALGALVFLRWCNWFRSVTGSTGALVSSESSALGALDTSDRVISYLLE